MSELVKRHGRKKPYTYIGIRRVGCVRCGNKATNQWQICADNSLYRPVCTACDIAINKLVLKFMRDPEWKEKIRVYKAQAEE